MSLKTIVPALFVLTSVAPAIQAMEADGHSTDVRLEVILLPESYDYTATADGTPSLNGSADFDQPFRVGLATVSHQRGITNGPIGLIGGGSLSYSQLPQDHGNISERYEALSIQARLGLGLYLGDFLHVEVTPFAGIGGGRGTINSDESDIGLYWEYGVSAGAFASLGSSLQLGIIGGWIHGEYDLDFKHDENFALPVNNVNVTLTQEGLFIGASIGVRM